MVVKALVVLGLAFLASVVYTTPVEKQKSFDCPPKEKFYKCHLEVCWKTCKHLAKPPPCPLIAANCYRPACECIDGYLRGEDGICIPEKMCPKF